MLVFSTGAHASIVIENAANYSTANASYLLWLADIGKAADQVQYTVDFETGFTAGQNVSGVSGLFPGGLVITDTGSAHSAKVQSSSTYFGGSKPVGSFALAHNESAYLELDFRANPVDYVSFRDIDHTGTSVIVHFTDGTTANTSFETTTGSGDNAEFFGIYRNDMPRITRVQLNATGDGEWGIDNIMYGIKGYSINGTLQLEDYSGYTEGILIVLELLTEDGSSVLWTENTGTGPGAAFCMHDVETGNYCLAIKPSHWLRKIVTAISITNADVDVGIVSVSNGDCDGDNEVTSTDLSVILSAMDTVPGDANWDAAADLDGDSEITSTDLSIVLTNMDMMGE